VQVPLPKKKLSGCVWAPLVLNTSGCKGRPIEQLRERCPDKLCKHMSQAERNAIKAKEEEKADDVENDANGAGEEIPKDDAVAPIEDDISEDRGWVWLLGF
jgi:hypothetical protein